MKKRLSHKQLAAHKNEHLSFIASSADAFDNGHIGEAKRIAVSLRVLFHETPKSHSILAQLHERQRAMLDSATPYDPRNMLTYPGLTIVRFENGTASFKAPLGDRPFPGRWIKFPSWWDNEIVLKDDQKRTFTRKKLVLFAANKDGGAHVDPTLDSTYERLRDGKGMGWKVFDTSGSKFLSDVVAHSIRQLAYEVIESLRHN